MIFLAFAILAAGSVLFWNSTNRIFRHDDPSNGVMVRCASGFVLVIAAASLGWIAL